MMFNISYSNRSKKFLNKADKVLVNRLIEKIEKLRENPIIHDIRTGSYPQIIHEQNHTTLDGSFINCTSFVDSNEKEYNDWIPAIRL